MDLNNYWKGTFALVIYKMASFNGASFSTIYIYEQGQSLPSIANKFADLVNTAGLHLCMVAL